MPTRQQDKSVWQHFCAAGVTLGSARREYPEWHQGRDRFCVWGLLPQDSQLIQTVDKLRDRFAPWIIQPYPRQPHITLAACGFWRSGRQGEDDYTEAHFLHHCEVLTRLQLPAFKLAVGGLNSFTSALYLEVEDASQRLQHLRQPLNTHFELDRHYVPHVTVGVYSHAHPIQELIKVIQQIPDDPLCITIDRIALLSYDARDIGSSLQVEHEIPLSISA